MRTRFFPTTKRCSACGEALEALLRVEREWTCPGCCSRRDRDKNAAKKLLQAGIRVIAPPPGKREVMHVEDRYASLV